MAKPVYAVPNYSEQVFESVHEYLSERGVALENYNSQIVRAIDATPTALPSTVDQPKATPNTINGKWLHRKMSVADKLAEKPWLIEILKSEGLI